MGRISLKVVPVSSRDEVVGWLGDSLKVKEKAPLEKGRANEAVVALLADRLGIDASSINVVTFTREPFVKKEGRGSTQSHRPPSMPLVMRLVLAAAVTLPAAAYAADAPHADAAAKDACIQACKKCHDACKAMRHGR